MSCLLPLVAGACLLDPSHVTIRADSTWLVTEKGFYYVDGHPYRGPVARLEVIGGGDLTSSLRLFYGVGHQSFLLTNRDRGYEYLLAGFEWRPFAQ